jgi:hypothetical protein
MLTKDEIRDGMTFILKLQNTAGDSVQWVEKLRGETALRWYDIYRRSDWSALRNEAGAVFSHAATEAEAESVRTSRQRCIYIHTNEVNANELVQLAAVGEKI